MITKLKVYNSFNSIPNNETIEDKIPIFASQKYADFIRETKNYHAIWIEAKEDGTHYIIPFAVMKKGPFKKGMFLTSVNSLGNVNTIKSEKEFLNEIVVYIKTNKLCDWIQQPPNWAIFNTYPDCSIYVPFGTYRINLEYFSDEQLLKEMHKSCRRAVRKATKRGVIIQRGKKYLIKVYHIISEAQKLMNLETKSYNYYKLLLDIFPNNLSVSIAFQNGNHQTGGISLYNKYSAYALESGMVGRNRDGAGNLLDWDSILYFKSIGVKYYDFVGARINPTPGSKQENIQLYKRHFGSKMKQGFLWKMVFNKQKYNIFIIYRKIMNLLKGRNNKGDIIDQERNRKKIK